MAAVLFALGAVLVVAGVAFVYWPAGVIAAGLAVVIAGALVDLLTDSYDREDVER